MSLRLALWALFFSLLADLCFGFYKTSMYPCHDRNAAMMFKAKEEMALCCEVEVSDKGCPMTLKLHKVDLDSDPSRYVNQSSGPSCFIQLTVPYTTVSDDGLYKCSGPAEDLVTREIYVIEKQQRLKFVSFVLGLSNKMEVKFTTEEVDPKLKRDNYTIMVQKTDTVFGLKDLCKAVLCEEDASPVICDGTSCTCKANMNRGCPHNSLLTLTLKVSRVLHDDVESEVNISSIEYIIPDIPINLSMTNVAALNAKGELALTKIMKEDYPYMELIEKPLWFSVLVEKLDGWKEKTTLNLTASNLNRKKGYNTLINMTFNLTDLVPFTKYSVRVEQYGSGGLGTTVEQIFSTKQTVPRRPPEIQKFDFSRHMEIENSTASLFVYWKSLPHEYQGGAGLAYVVKLYTTEGDELGQTMVKNGPAVFDTVPDNTIIVRIWAVNDVGTSENFAEITIPFYKGLDPQVHTEFTHNGHRARVMGKVQGVTVENWAIHLCEGLGFVSYCQEYPSSQMSAQTGDVLDQEVILEKPPPSDTEIVRTKRTIAVVNNYLFDDVETFESIEVPVKYIITADVEAWSKDVASAASVPGSGLALHAPLNTDVLKSRSSQVFVSAMIGGFWTGLLPTNCYYDRSATIVTLDISELEDSLVWYQSCNKELPQQFLASEYQVYLANNETCQQEGNMSVITNSVFEKSRLSIQNYGMYACIRAKSFTRSDGRSVMSHPEEHFLGPVKETQQLSSSSETVIIIVVCFVVPFLAFGLGKVIYKFWRRGRTLRKEAMQQMYVTKIESETCYDNDDFQRSSTKSTFMDTEGSISSDQDIFSKSNGDPPPLPPPPLTTRVPIGNAHYTLENSKILSESSSGAGATNSVESDSCLTVTTVSIERDRSKPTVTSESIENSQKSFQSGTSSSTGATNPVKSDSGKGTSNTAVTSIKGGSKERVENKLFEKLNLEFDPDNIDYSGSGGDDSGSYAGYGRSTTHLVYS